MYTQFYEFKEKPFRLTPDPDFFYQSSVHRQALAYLTYGLEDKQGFIAITGEIGSGKTTVLQVLLSSLKDTTKVAKINNTKVTSLELLDMIVRDFGLKAEGSSKTDLLDILNNFLVEQHALGNHVLLILDEAQNFSASLLEEIRLLSNLETSKEKLLQIVLSGQPELGDKLRLPELRQLAQRITITFHMTGLDRKETEGYIHYRLQVAGNRNKGLFTTGAIDRITEFSKGIPRMINIICDAALLTGFVNEKKQIDETIAREVIEELKAAYNIPTKEEPNLITQETQNQEVNATEEIIVPNIKALQATSLLEKKLEELSSKLDLAFKNLEKIENIENIGQEQSPKATQEVESLLKQEKPTKAPLKEKRPLRETSRKARLSQDNPPKSILVDYQEERSLQETPRKTRLNPDSPSKSILVDYQGKEPKEGYSESNIPHEFITNSSHFPLFSSLLKINAASFFTYINDITHLILWVGTFIQTWFLGSRGLERHKFLGNLISPLIYSGVGLIFRGSSFLQQSELIAFWGYSLLIGLLQAIQVRVTKGAKMVIGFFEALIRLMLIPILYILYTLEKDGKNINLSAVQGFLAEFFKTPIQTHLTEIRDVLQDFPAGLSKAPLQAYLLEAVIILGILYGLSKMLQAKKYS